MNPRTIPITLQAPDRQRKREAPKGRRVDADARDAVRALLGDASRQRDLLIEHLHRLQDHFGHLSAAHLAALAAEMGLAQTEVYEVATFYHHFDVVKEGEAAPAALTVRVCDGLSCEMAGAQDLLRRLPKILGKDVRVIAAPCIGRCEQAPAVAVGQQAVGHASCEAVQAAVTGGKPAPRAEAFVDRAAYEAQGGYRLLKRCIAGELEVETVIQSMEDSGLRGLGGAGFPAGRKWRIVRNETAPRLMAVNIDEGEPGTFKDRVYLERDPHRFIEGMLIAAWAVGIARIYVYLRDEYHDCRSDARNRAGAAARQSALPRHARDRAAARRRRLHLRRRVGDDRIDRRQARHAAPAPAVRGAGRPVRPADAGAQLRDAVLGARDPRKGRRLVQPRTAATAARGCARSRSRVVSGARASSWRRPASRSAS